MKRCSKCREEKPVSEFHRAKVNKDGLYSYCKPCNAKSQAEKRIRNPEILKKDRNYYLKSEYGITEEKYLEMVAAQNGVCAICFSPETGRRLAVDHCHSTGMVRGLLCGHCNLALGGFRDKPDLLLSALSYLKQASKCR